MDVRERLTDEICNKRRVTTLKPPAFIGGSFFAAGSGASRCADWRTTRTPHRGEQLQANSVPANYRGRIRAPELVDADNATHHSPGTAQ